jgi:hypothetical protein
MTVRANETWQIFISAPLVSKIFIKALSRERTFAGSKLQKTSIFSTSLFYLILPAVHYTYAHLPHMLLANTNCFLYAKWLLDLSVNTIYDVE